MVTLSALNTLPRVSPLEKTPLMQGDITPAQVTSGPVASNTLNRFGQLPAIGSGQNLKAQGGDEEIGALLKMLGALVGTLKSLTATDNAVPDRKPPVNVVPDPPVTPPVNVVPEPVVEVVPTPVPDSVQPTETPWRNTLAPFMTRPNLASTRNSFDTELIEMFSDQNYVPPSAFLSAKAKGQAPEDIQNGLRATYENFPYLGTLGREEHIGAIKVAMMKFGQSPAGIFNEVTAVKDGYNVTMRDGYKLHISGEELALATKAAKFSGGDEGMVKDARFLFAAMSKRQHMEQALHNESDPFMRMYGKDSSYHAYRTYPGVLATAGNGINGDSAMFYLGLKNHIKIVDAQTLGAQTGVPLDKGNRQKNGAIIQGVMEGQLYNKAVSPSLKVVMLGD